jgi:hypothetical protein
MAYVADFQMNASFFIFIIFLQFFFFNISAFHYRTMSSNQCYPSSLLKEGSHSGRHLLYFSTSYDNYLVCRQHKTLEAIYS